MQVGVRTIFAEPVNIRAENVARIDAHAAQLGINLNTSVFKDAASWQAYAIETLKTVERTAVEIGVGDRLHLWPDKALGTKVALRRLPVEERESHMTWLQRCWNRVSEWPTS